MAETPNPINDAPPSSSLEVGHDDVEEALLKKLPRGGENTDTRKRCLVCFEETIKSVCGVCVLLSRNSISTIKTFTTIPTLLSCAFGIVYGLHDSYC